MFTNAFTKEDPFPFALVEFDQSSFKTDLIFWKRSSLKAPRLLQ